MQQVNRIIEWILSNPKKKKMIFSILIWELVKAYLLIFFVGILCKMDILEWNETYLQYTCKCKYVIIKWKQSIKNDHVFKKHIKLLTQ